MGHVEYKTIARCGGCYWGGYTDQCEGNCGFYICPVCRQVSIFEYERVVTRREVEKCAVDEDSIHLIENSKAQFKKRWWQK